MASVASTGGKDGLDVSQVVRASGNQLVDDQVLARREADAVDQCRVRDRLGLECRSSAQEVDLHAIRRLDGELELEVVDGCEAHVQQGASQFRAGFVVYQDREVDIGRLSRVGPLVAGDSADESVFDPLLLEHAKPEPERRAEAHGRSRSRARRSLGLSSICRRAWRRFFSAMSRPISENRRRSSSVTTPRGLFSDPGLSVFFSTMVTSLVFPRDGGKGALKGKVL